MSWPIVDGVYVFTGGQISGDEALAVFNAIREPASNQKGSVFYDWDPPGDYSTMAKAPNRRLRALGRTAAR